MPPVCKVLTNFVSGTKQLVQCCRVCSAWIDSAARQSRCQNQRFFSEPGCKLQVSARDDMYKQPVQMCETQCVPSDVDDSSMLCFRFLQRMVKEGLLEPTASKDAYRVSHQGLT